MSIAGHYTPIHSWEAEKAGEPMWIFTEVWDTLAKEHSNELKKGAEISGVGYMFNQKWLDKTTGDERKSLKLRISRISPSQDIFDIVSSNNLNPAVVPMEDTFDPSDFE